MATVHPSRRDARDASGNAYSGALLYVYDAGTNNLSSIYTNAALTIPAANPVVADSNGIWPQWYAAEGSLFDLTPKTAGGVALPWPELSVAAVGSQTGSLTRDFTTSRFAARGSGGTTFIEAGDASPDNVGGTMVIGGWNNTQADSITANSALFNVVGRIKENSYKLPGVVRSEAVSFSAASSVDIPLTNDPTGTLVWDIEINAFDLSTTGVTVQVRFSYDNGSTYLATSTYYSNSFLADAVLASMTGSTIQDAQTSGIILSGANTTSPVATSGQIRMRVSTPDGSGARATTLMGTAVMFAASSHLSLYHFGVSNAHGSRATHVRLICGSGNFSGVYRVLPQRGFGET